MFVYILECSDKTFYTGSTIDISKRLHQHNNLKSGAHYTKLRRPVILKYFEKCENFKEMRKREIAVKKLSREKKIEMLKGFAENFEKNIIVL
jgi:putative endonuclease